MNEDKITYKNVEGFAIPTFNCSECGHKTEGFTICLKCNPQTYTVLSDGLTESVLYKEIWNEAIEAATKFVHSNNLERMRKELNK